MNYKIILSILLPIFAISIYLGLNQYNLHKDVEKLKSEKIIHHSNSEEEIELAVYMNRLQLFMNKLWFAGKNNNWDLASFYVEELEETMEEIAKNPIEEDGVRIDQLMKVHGTPSIEKIEEEVNSKNAQGFFPAYDNLILSCNKCHEDAQHPFIKIKIPDVPVFTNQIY